MAAHEGPVRTARRATVAAVLLAVTALLLSVLQGGAATAGASSENTHPGAAAAQLGVDSQKATTYTQDLEFTDSFQTHVFTIRVASGGNRLVAESLDCCLEGDHWGLFIMRFGGTPLGVNNPNDSNCGTGSTSNYSGRAALSGTFLSGRAVKVVVTHCSGVSAFPAGMTVRFSSNVDIVVTQRS